MADSGAGGGAGASGSLSYHKTIGGALSLKGLGALKKTKKDKKKKHKKHKKRSRPVDDGDNDDEVILVQKRGTGRLVTSGTTVHGKDTKFMDELSIGDAIIITHPTSHQDETRIVTMVLSNMSISISSPFSSDLISSTSFHYVKKPKTSKEVEDEKQSEQTKRRRKKEEEDKLAFGTYAGNSTFTYRVRKASAYGGYKIVTQKVDAGGEGLSREKLLDMRSKKKADRMCM